MPKLTLSPDVRALNPAAGRTVSIAREQARKARVPRAPRDEGVGLTALQARGWCSWSDGTRWRLYVPGGADTGEQPNVRAACERAKELER